jgi:virginiamycin B lyase
VRTLTLCALAAVVIVPETLTAQTPPTGGQDVIREWEVEWGGRSRDPFVAPDGKVWFVGQAGNYIAYFDPETEGFRRYEIEDGTNPHNLIVDESGMVWYAGNRNGRIGKLDPATGDVEVFMTGEARDPHTLVFDGRGGIWFTSQQANRVGRLDMATGEYRLVTPHESPRARPYGIVMDRAGHPWVSLFGTNHVVRIDPETLEITRFEKADEGSRSRRIAITDDGAVWYGDEARGYLGRVDPATGEVREFAMPGGGDARPYALTRDDRGVLWISQTGPDKRLVAFDPRQEQFIANHGVSHNIRHTMFDPATGTLWFGTDANAVGRVLTRGGAR